MSFKNGRNENVPLENSAPSMVIASRIPFRRSHSLDTNRHGKQNDACPIQSRQICHEYPAGLKGGSEDAFPEQQKRIIVTSQRAYGTVEKASGNLWTPKLDALKESTAPKIRKRVKSCPDALFRIQDDYLHDASEGIIKNNRATSSPTKKSDIRIVPTDLEEYSNRQRDTAKSAGSFRSFLDLIKQKASSVSLSTLSSFRRNQNIRIQYDTFENFQALEETAAESQPFNGSSDQENMQTVDLDNRQSNEEHATYFSTLLQKATVELEEKRVRWNAALQDGSYHTLAGEIRSVIGQTNLLVSDRFKQFEGLVRCFVNPRPGDKPIMKSDLEGFWEMISFQIEDIMGKFENLEKNKVNRKPKQGPSKGIAKRSNGAGTSKVNTKGAVSASQYKDDARKRLKEAKNAMKERIIRRDNSADDLKARILNETQSED